MAKLFQPNFEMTEKQAEAWAALTDTEDELDEESLTQELCGYGIWLGDTLEQGGLSDVGNYLTL